MVLVQRIRVTVSFIVENSEALFNGIRKYCQKAIIPSSHNSLRYSTVVRQLPPSLPPGNARGLRELYGFEEMIACQKTLLYKTKNVIMRDFPFDSEG